ncbi:MAG: Pr6Pr family membrane protein [Pseudomonadota bacterium]|nr:Pr6Pr family membrane protein [Pseudomonadota bacterium]
MLTKLSAMRIGLAALALIAMGQQLFLHVAASYSVLNFFSYFTNLSNLFASFVLLATVALASRSSAPDVMRYVSAVNMAVVGIVFAVLLRDADLGQLRPWINFVLHYVMPVAIVVDWMLQPPVRKLNATHLAITLVFPATYLVYTLLRGMTTGWYPYPFLNPATAGGYTGVAMYSLGIFVAFLVVGFALLAVGNRSSTEDVRPSEADS